MGLTIHYQLKTKLTGGKETRTLVESLRQFAQDLPFKEVSGLVELQGTDADFSNADKDDPFRWLKIQAGQYVQDSERHFDVTPTHVIAFSTWPGEGCEEANFGFCRYPAFIDCPTRLGRKKRYTTHLGGWRWKSFCKTQYASDPRLGGLSHFLRCHLCVIKLLDFAKATRLVDVEVSDEGGYWQHRDLEKLGREVGDWNAFVAACAGLVQDAAKTQGITVESAIAGFSNFEHLEAQGQAKIEKLRASLANRKA